MAEHIWSVLCTRTIVDEGTKQLSLIDTADVFWVGMTAAEIEMGIESAKAEGKLGLLVPTKLSFTSCWYRNDQNVPDACIATTSLLNPRGEPVQAWRYEVKTNEGIGYRHTVNIVRFPVTALGLHVFVVQRMEAENEWLTVATVPLEVAARELIVSTEQPPPSEPTPAAAPESSSPPEPPRPSTRRAGRAQRRRRS